VLFTACTNNPYRPNETGRNIYYDTFSGEPKHLDPARAYSEDEAEFMNQIYETVVQYHFLKRPYVLTSLTATTVPEAKLYDGNGNLLPADAPADTVAKAVYEISLRPGIRSKTIPPSPRPPTANIAGIYNWESLSPQSSIRMTCRKPALANSERKTTSMRSNAWRILYSIARSRHC